MIILFYTLCEETRVEHERPMAICCETGGYKRRTGMSLGDKTIVCGAEEALPCECMLTSNSHVVHREVWLHAVRIHTEKCIMFEFT